MDTLKASYERRLMEYEEHLTSEQIKCREVTKQKCDNLENDLKQLRAQD